VKHFQTHLSHVFVAPPFAYKLKKPVKLSFVDFSTSELRRSSCEAEVALNRRLCAPLYLGVIPVTRAENGHFALESNGSVVEHLVWMRALPEDGMLQASLPAGRVKAHHLVALAGELARFHAAAPTSQEITESGEIERLRQRWNDVLENSRDLVGKLLTEADLAVLLDFGARFLARHQALLGARRTAGRIREGHGDLHCANLCLIEPGLPPVAGAPSVPPGLYAFDCIEFSAALRWNDVASEVAFLAMDLELRGHCDLAEAFVGAYVEASNDSDLRMLLPFYATHRACVRGMVHGRTALAAEIEQAQRADAEKQARDLFAWAISAAWCAAGPALVICMGLSGSGKTTLAAALANTTGFALLSSDELRKRRAGLDPRQPTPRDRTQELYARDARRAVYLDLAAAAEAELGRGTPVIADATFTARADRDLLASVARKQGCPYVFLECVADTDMTRTRLEERAQKGAAPSLPALSDAGWEIYLEQKRRAEALAIDEPSRRIATAGDVEQVRARALAMLWRWRCEHPVVLRAGLTPLRSP
jgi:aminoglycoside phosphotransferase family enzyme/predicted kinase